MGWISPRTQLTSYIGAHFVVLGVITVVSGHVLLIPSLGPSAYDLAINPDAKKNYPHRVIGGQIIGVVAGVVAYLLVVPTSTAIRSLPPLSWLAVRYALAALIALILTTELIAITDMEHPPAYATTLLISIGFLTSVIQITFFIIALMALIGFHLLSKRLPIWDLPYTEVEE